MPFCGYHVILNITSFGATSPSAAFAMISVAYSSVTYTYNVKNQLCGGRAFVQLIITNHILIKRAHVAFLDAEKQKQKTQRSLLFLIKKTQCSRDM